MSKRKRVAIFGGTFDPVHRGHVHMALLAKEAAELDEVRFLPCRISPHKLGVASAAAEDRLEMLRIAIRDLPWARVDDVELRSAGPSYSYLTAEAFAGNEPETDWFWLMGGDQWEALLRWKHPERLAAVVGFLVVARGAALTPRKGFRMQTIPGEHPASATQIRQSVQEGLMIKEWLHPEVADYIQAKRLYCQQPPLAPAETSD